MCVSIDIVVDDSVDDNAVVADCSIDEVDCDGTDVGSVVDGKSVIVVVGCSVETLVWDGVDVTSDDPVVDADIVG